MEVGGRLKGGDIYVYIYIYIYTHLWLVHIVVWQTQPQHCKAVILQLKINVKNTQNTVGGG